MTLSPMRFGDYIWPHNPKVYEIAFKRRVVLHKVPFGQYALSGMGREQRVLSGEGEFVGGDAYEQFKKLATVFYSDKPQILVHPIWQSAPAWFVNLTLKQSPRKDYVSYAFDFWECFEGYETVLTAVSTDAAKTTLSGTESAKRSAYTLKAGDTLWGLASRSGLSLNELLKLNPQIRNPNVYSVGDVIYLS